MKKLFLKIKEDLLAYFILIAGFFLRLFYIFNFTRPENYLFSDPGGYDWRALMMAKDEFFLFSTYWPPFFHIFLSLIYRPILWLGLENWRIKIDVVMFAIFYIIAFWCIYKITEKLFSKKMAIGILIALIFWYPFIFFNYFVMSENLLFLLLFLGLYILIVKPIKISNGIWLGFFWGLAFLTRPVFALAIPFFVLWGLYYKIDRKFLIAFSIIVGLIMISMMAFNFWYTNGEVKSFSSNGGVGFAMLWCDTKSLEFTADGYTFGFGPPGYVDYPDSKRVFTNVPFDNQGYYYKMGLDCLVGDPLKIITNFSSIGRLFNSHLFPTMTTEIYGWEFLRFIFRSMVGFLFLASLITMLSLRWKWFYVKDSNKKYFWLFALIILSLFITVYLQNPAEERYMIPYTPLLMILSLPFLTNALPPLKIESYKRLWTKKS
jgi:4-amino-4-deoxy-L-arabinose transferase-like glycosyltransferase